MTTPVVSSGHNMPQSKLLKMYHISKEWSGGATVHGLPRVFFEDSGYFRRSVWACIFLGGLAFTIHSIYAIVVAYESFSHVSSVDIIHRRDMSFPSVTVCARNPVNCDRACVNSSMVDICCALGCEADEYGLVADIAECELITPKVKLTLRDQMRYAGWTVEDLIQIAYFNGQLVESVLEADGGQFKHFLDYRRGNCYVFETDTLVAQPSTAYGGGLHMVLDADESHGPIHPSEHGLQDWQCSSNQPIPICTSAAVVHINNMDHTPTPTSNFVNAPPGFMTDLAVETDVLNRWKQDPNQACNNDPTYSQWNCVENCELCQVIPKCGCTTLCPDTPCRLMGDKTDTPCRECSTYEEFVCANNELRALMTSSNLACACDPACVQTSFTTTVSLLKLDSRTNDLWKTKNLTRNVEGEQRDMNPDKFASLVVHFNSLNLFEVNQNQAYTPSQLFADLGGSGGLFLGLSIIGFVEFLELMYGLVVSLLSNPSHTSTVVVKPSKVHADHDNDAP
mmetsp:Transcript_41268/g.78876  ORF Transcript_41268/g.78876 Transcript_41268/m.78876 type:complete len:508 (-) Transcript_41268:247-1770(-)